MQKKLIALTLLVILLAGCRITVEPKTEVPIAAATAAQREAASPAATDTPSALPSATPANVSTVPSATSTEAAAIPNTTPTPMPTPSPADTATATPRSLPTQTPTPALPMITVNTNLNVRNGPDVAYARIGQLAEGVSVEIIGRNADASWWQIAYSNASTGQGWIAAGYGESQNTEDIPVVEARELPATPTPAEPSPTPVPTTPPIDFVVKSVRLWTNEENGGHSDGGSVVSCGYGHNIFITILDAAGNPLDGVVLEDTYKTLRQITGSRGPGRAEYIFWGNGYQLSVVEDNNAGREVTSEISPLMSPKDEEIPTSWLVNSHYCANEAECSERVSKNLLCRGHYSFDIVFQRTW